MRCKRADIHSLPMTQRHLALADIVGARQATISMIESGSSNLTVEMLPAVADALDAEIVVVPRCVLTPVRNIVADYLAPEEVSSNRV